jgi:hypothetical protein
VAANLTGQTATLTIGPRDTDPSAQNMALELAAPDNKSAANYGEDTSKKILASRSGYKILMYSATAPRLAIHRPWNCHPVVGRPRTPLGRSAWSLDRILEGNTSPFGQWSSAGPAAFHSARATCASG